MKTTRVYTCHSEAGDLDKAIFDATIDANDFLQRQEENLEMIDFAAQTFFSHGKYHHVISLVYRKRNDE